MAEETSRSGNGHSLEAAMALLINNQAALVAKHTAFVSEIAEIRKLFDKIMAVLARHEMMLEKLPEAVRDKIGFKN